MYNLPYYKEKNQNVILDFIARYPFAFISGCDAENRPVATQIPVFVEESNGRKILRGHIMRNTDHHKAFAQNDNVLVVFTGKHTYVSATWYSNPSQASTWNYMSVHVKGTIKFLDPSELGDVLRKVSLHFENYNENSSTVFDNLTNEYKQRLMHAIVAFEIEILEMDTVFKLSQDRDPESFRNIVKKLKAQTGDDGPEIADEMEKRFHEIFPDAQ
jgi:transcriptional regulator